MLEVINDFFRHMFFQMKNCRQRRQYCHPGVFCGSVVSQQELGPCSGGLFQRPSEERWKLWLATCCTSFNQGKSLVTALEGAFERCREVRGVFHLVRLAASTSIR